MVRSKQQLLGATTFGPSSLAAFPFRHYHYCLHWEKAIGVAAAAAAAAAVVVFAGGIGTGVGGALVAGVDVGSADAIVAGRLAYDEGVRVADRLACVVGAFASGDGADAAEAVDQHWTLHTVQPCHPHSCHKK